MSEICQVCGLPKEICACQTIEKETTAQIRIYTAKKRFNKLVTFVEGLADNELVEVSKELKRKLACGGSSKDGMVVLQGNHAVKVRDFLVKMGYPKEAIRLG